MDTDALVALASERLLAAADPSKAGPMAAYMKTDMPFHGVQKAERVPILRELVRSFVPEVRAEYEASVRALWSCGHREEKYLALGYARAFPPFVDAGSTLLYRDLIVTGAWWDLVDETATKLVGTSLRKDPGAVTPTIRRWITDVDMWLRRTGIICQLGFGAATDVGLLEDACTSNQGDREFFIRKAIGWALRDYARTDPDWVRTFVDDQRSEMAPLSVREAMKHL